MILTAIRRTASVLYPLFPDKLYLRAYTLGSNVHAAIDRSAAVGGRWDEVGALLFSALRAQGLQPGHAFLDFGCGSLRVGRHVIAYLDDGRYVGADMAGNLLNAARDVVAEDGLESKRPRLIKTKGELDFSFVDGRFDYIFAGSVFSHLRREMIAECMSHLKDALSPEGVFLFTFLEGEGEFNGTAFRQPWSFYETQAQELGLIAERHGDEIDGERLGQTLAAIRLRTSAN